jgi:hypothetical protein
VQGGSAGKLEINQEEGIHVIRRIRSRINSAHVLAAAALFVALGGSAVAATFGNNSVKSRHIVDNKVKSKDLKDDKGVQTADVVEGTLTSGDFSTEARGAYGRVDPGGGLSLARNVTGVSHPGPGVYCITAAAGIDPAASVLVVTSDQQQNGTGPGTENHSVVEWDSQVDGCPGGTFEVNSFLYDGDATDDDGGATDSPGDNLEPNNEAFSFVIP